MRSGLYRLIIIRFGIAAFATLKEIGTYHLLFVLIDINLGGLGLVFAWGVIIPCTDAYPINDFCVFFDSLPR